MLNLKDLGKSLLVGGVVMAGLVGCGKAGNQAALTAGTNGSIIGGEEATGREDFAKHVVLLYNVGQGSICTASILSDSILVTAAHCTDGPASSMRVVFGTDIEGDDKIVQKVVSYEVSALWAFRSDEAVNAGDISVVRFSGGLPAGYEPASILKKTELLSTGATVLLAGYGNDNGAEHSGSGKLRFVETTIKDGGFSESEILIEQSKGKGACHGDSGGPAFVKVNGKWALWGVTNRGVNDPNNDCSVSAAYASIPYYRDWVTKTARELNAGTTGNNMRVANGQ